MFERLQLRVRDFNFDAGILTIHGKGKKDRTLPLPESILDELHRQMDRVKKLHEKDLEEGYDGVWMGRGEEPSGFGLNRFLDNRCGGDCFY